MRKRALHRTGQICLVFAIACLLVNCQAAHQATTTPPPPTVTLVPTPDLTGVLMWKGNPSVNGLYANETKLTPANVNVSQFGKLGEFKTDAIVMAQPLYVSGLDMGAGQTHDVVIVATEDDSVYAFDAANPGGGSLWERHYVDPANGILTMPDNFGGRTTLGGEVGITGTPYIDPSSGVMYFVTTLTDHGVPQQWLRAIDIHNGKDFGPGSVQIAASVPGDGRGSVNGQIAFDPSNQNQRAGLTEANGEIIVSWGSFSDWGVYHGWMMAFDPTTLHQVAVFNPTTQFQAVDAANGPSDHGGGGSFWQGGAAPAVDSGGDIYVNAADGSFNANQGGNNYGDTMLKLKLSASGFQVADWFTPFNADCIDLYDLEIGSGGVALLPTDSTNGLSLALAAGKEGRLFLVNLNSMGHFNATADTQITEDFMIGSNVCSDSITGDVAEGTTWNRLYGTASYWNGNVYAAPANSPLKQYQFQSGLLNQAPLATSPDSYGLRGANTVVSAKGKQNGIVWAYEKTAAGTGTLHAYDATNVSNEIWNSNMNAERDALGGGIGFAVPAVADGRVIVPYDMRVGVFGLLQ
ncbi:MAG TPA: hypothetical protein VFO46_11405 [Candidatus Sulfotelmatobacter sp.]|nr:hypothetical protein [Candidatus Sulfotelmatobacter sp.]